MPKLHKDSDISSRTCGKCVQFSLYVSEGYYARPVDKHRHSQTRNYCQPLPYIG